MLIFFLILFGFIFYFIENLSASLNYIYKITLFFFSTFIYETMVFMMIYYDINRTLKNFFTYIFKFEIRVDQEWSLAYVRKKVLLYLLLVEMIILN